MSKSYVFWYSLVYPLVRLLYPCSIFGRENIQTGPMIICANHSNLVDPVLIAIAFGRKRQLFFMGKAELFRAPLLGSVLRAVEAFPVQRGETDIGAIRTAMKHLKSGNQIMMFPEGTRVTEAETVDAKSGAVRIATKMNVPIQPIYVSTKKKVFHCSKLVVGKPYLLSQPADKNYAPLAEELMRKIQSMEKEH